MKVLERKFGPKPQMHKSKNLPVYLTGPLAGLRGVLVVLVGMYILEDFKDLRFTKISATPSYLLGKTFFFPFASAPFKMAPHSIEKDDGKHGRCSHAKLVRGPTDSTKSMSTSRIASHPLKNIVYKRSKNSLRFKLCNGEPIFGIWQ